MLLHLHRLLLALALGLAPVASLADSPATGGGRPVAIAEQGPAAASEGPADAGSCAALPEPDARIAQALADSAGAAPGALLVLSGPALGDPSEAQGLLADGVEVVSSFWSPLLCASITRLRGPAELPTGRWAPDLPEGGLLVPDDRYHTSASRAPAGAVPVADTPDPYRPLQYALDELGVDASRAITRGAGTRIAVLDSTPQSDHPDLPALSVPARFVPDEASRHGTLVVGVLAARAGNGFGIAGLVPEATVLPVPVCRAATDAAEGGDECALFDVLQGLDAAWEVRAHIVNLSLAGPPNPLLQGAADRLAALGVSLVAAAGNDASEEPLYPAAYPSVIGVGATGRQGDAYSRGNRGPGTELTAPGVDVVSTAPRDGFAFADGTSLATVHVSGVLALLASASGDLTLARQALFRSARRHPRATRRVGVLPTVCEALAELDRACATNP